MDSKLIPHQIHYCWFGKAPLPATARQCIDSWKRFFPDYDIIQWDESNFDVDACAYAREAYRAKKWAFVSDYARFVILYNHGGLYFDTDVEVIKSMDDVVAAGSFMGIEKFVPGKPPRVAPGLGLGAVPGEALYREIIDQYEKSHFVLPNGSCDLQNNVVVRTTDILIRHGMQSTGELQNVSGINIYPKEYFSPKDVETHKLVITPNTRTIHHYDASWAEWYDKAADTRGIRLRKLLGKKLGNALNVFIYTWQKEGFSAMCGKLLRKLKKSPQLAPERPTKIGILTDFYRQGNYGGILQAYALAKAVTSLGYRCEQIRYDRKNDPSVSQKIRYFIYRWRHFYPITEFINRLQLMPMKNKIAARQRQMDKFIAEKIPASAAIYDRKNIASANNVYCGFIAGSDQIWSAFSRTNLLDFVAPDKPKFSYAASIARDPLGALREELFKELLPAFEAVSVREKGSVAQLAKLGLAAQWVLDPCLLYDQTDWDTIRSEQLVKEPYVFAYFLGEAPELRKLAQEYARSRNLKLVTLPYLQKKYLRADRDCGDLQLFEAAPGDFISLIAHADTVLTDSFHCTVFSYLYQKHFIVFDRELMNMRIDSILELFDDRGRMLNYRRAQLADILNIPRKEVSENALRNLQEMRALSWAFLKENLLKIAAN